MNCCATWKARWGTETKNSSTVRSVAIDSCFPRRASPPLSQDRVHFACEHAAMRVRVNAHAAACARAIASCIAHLAEPLTTQAVAQRISVVIFRKYMEAMHESMQSKDNRIMWLLRQLEEARADAQILRLAPPRDADASDYDLYQSRLAASDREQLRAKDRMLELYDEREEDNQHAVHQLHETVRFLTQRVDALLIVQV